MTNENETVEIHLAFRKEGQMFNAYVESKGAKPFLELVGSISVEISEDDPAMFVMWHGLMTKAVIRKTERVTGEPAQFIGRRTVPVGGTA